MGRKIVNISGEKYGKFLVLDEKPSKINNYKWKCLCDCGEISYIKSSDFKRGRENFCAKCNDIKSKDAPIRNLFSL